MIATEPGLRSVALWLTGCLLLSSAMFDAMPVAAETGAKASTKASALMEAMTLPGPPGLVTRGYFDDNPGCVRAKLDIWFARGRHTHQLFTPRAEPDPVPLSAPPDQGAPSSRQTAESDPPNPPVQAIMDGGGTTILVGREGCRIRIRIERAE